MGFDVITMLNCKRHLDVLQNPSSGAGYAARDTTSAHMTTAFGDGTKMQVEQAVVANATGMVPDVRGMHGLETTQDKLIKDLTATVSAHNLVEYTLGGDFGAGVGVVARHPDHQLHKKSLSLYKMGDGPDYFFFRPYHLVHLELPLTIAEVLLDGEALATVTQPHSVEVVAIAKKTLRAGEQLDCIGGYCAYGHIDQYEHSTEFLPIGLVEFATMTRDVPVNEPIPLNSLTLDDSMTVVQQWLSQRQQWAQGTASARAANKVMSA
jgi:predicted homoserine dehydrogenase-like protein